LLFGGHFDANTTQASERERERKREEGRGGGCIAGPRALAISGQQVGGSRKPNIVSEI